MTQSPDDKPLPNESQLEFLRRKERFHELLLFAWGEIEFYIDQLVARQYGLYVDYNERKVKFLLDMSFDRKLRFLKRVGAVSKDEFRVIHTFQEKRNDFFHSQGWITGFMMSQDERKKVMDEAVEVVMLVSHLLSH